MSVVFSFTENIIKIITDTKAASCQLFSFLTLILSWTQRKSSIWLRHEQSSSEKKIIQDNRSSSSPLFCPTELKTISPSAADVMPRCFRRQPVTSNITGFHFHHFPVTGSEGLCFIRWWWVTEQQVLQPKATFQGDLLTASDSDSLCHHQSRRSCTMKVLTCCWMCVVNVRSVTKTEEEVQWENERMFWMISG